MVIKKRLVVEVHTPAFGGRGFFAICRRGTAPRPLRPKVSVRSKTPCVRSTGWEFDSTLGFPGEGPENNAWISSWEFDSTLGFPGEGPENNAWISSKASMFTPHTSLCIPIPHCSLPSPLTDLMGRPVSAVMKRLKEINVSTELIQQLLSFEQHEQNRKCMIISLQRFLRKIGKRNRSKDRHIKNTKRHTLHALRMCMQELKFHAHC